MRVTMICVFLSILLSACGREPSVYYRDNGEVIGGDPELLKMYHDNLLEFEAAGLDLTNERNVVLVQYADLSGRDTAKTTILGLCEYKDSGYVISLNPDLKRYHDELAEVLVHEMGHCVLGERHFDDGVDIMNTLLKDPDLLWSDFVGYKRQMFERIRTRQEIQKRLERPARTFIDKYPDFL